MNIEEKLDLYVTENEDNLIFTGDNAEDVVKEIQDEIEAPFVKTTISKLGGSPTIMMKISLDSKKEWKNSIYENSRYMNVILHPDASKSNLEISNMSHKIDAKRMKKQKAKSVKEAIKKLNNYIDKIK